MQNVAHEITDVNRLQQENRQLLRKIEQNSVIFERKEGEYRKRIAYLENQLQEARKEKKAVQTLVGIPNNKLSAADKVVTLATQWDIENRDKRPDGKTPVYYPNIAERAGVSRFTVIKSIDSLEKSGAVDKDVQRDKQGKSHVAIAFTPAFLASPDSIVEQIEEESNHGGDRRKPCSCGCGEFIKRVRKQVTYICKGCGNVQVEDETVTDTTVNAYDESEQGLPSFDDIENMHIDRDVADVPDEEYLATFDETPTLFPVEKKPVPVPVGLFPNRPCFGCETTNWKAYTDEEGTVKAYCATCTPEKGN